MTEEIKIQSTVEPEERLTINDWFNYIYTGIVPTVPKDEWLKYQIVVFQDSFS